MNIVNNITARQVYDNGLALLSQAQIELQNAVLSQSFLRTEVLLSTGKTQYHIPILENDTDGGNNGNPFITEQRLKLQDAFVTNQLGIFLAVPSSATDATFKLLTFVDPQIFTTSGAAAATQTVYNGKLRIEVNGKVIVPFWDISRHQQVNQTQNGVGVTEQTIFPISQIDGTSDAFYPVEPNLVMVGSKNINMNIILPAAIGTLQANSRLIVIQRGILAQNSTSVY